MKYTCETCHKTFKQKGHLEGHKNRKRPCKKDNTIEELVEKKIQEALSKTNEVIVNNMSPDQESTTILELKELCKQKKLKGISKKSKTSKTDLMEPVNPEPVNETVLDLTDMINKVAQFIEFLDIFKLNPYILINKKRKVSTKLS